jgi:hypothetical protein
MPKKRAEIDPKTGQIVAAPKRRATADSARRSTLTIYTSAAHRDYIQHAAEICGFSVSSFCENAVLAWIKEHVVPKKPGTVRAPKSTP